MRCKRTDRRPLIAALAWLLLSGTARADDTPTPGFPEKIIQWGVRKGETCEDIASAVYGSPKHRRLLLRYNRITCTPGAPLKEGLTLVLPAEVSDVPTARITSVNPDTRARTAGGGWSPAYSGQGLSRNSNVNTREEGRAAIRFVDRSRIYLAEHTLVVIFGTASETAVSKDLPPVAEVRSGELQAGLDALRPGRSADIAIAGGGRVNATSKDTVIRKKQARATVSVFDGAARVSSAGESVAVPTRYGSAVVDNQPPTPPRPLPPAPAWDEGGSPLVTLADHEGGVLQARWKAIPNAASYRVEVATEPDFSTIVLREETPPDVFALRAEKIPPGDYWLRVRAIDTEDFLGLASTRRAVSVVRASFSRGNGALGGAGIEVSPYGALELAPSADLTVAIGDGAFGPVPPRIDFAQSRPPSLRFKRRGEPEEMTVPIRYVPPKARLSAAVTGEALAIAVELDDLRGVDAAEVIAPRARLRTTDGAVRELALVAAGPDRFEARTDAPTEPMRLDVVDRQGTVLASEIVGPASASTPPAPEPPPVRIGPTLPMRPFSPRLDVMGWAPVTTSTATLGASADTGDGSGASLSGDAYVAGGIGAFGLDLSVRHRRRLDDTASGSAGWLGGRYRVIALDDVQLGTSLRLGFPLDDAGPPLRLEPSVGAGAAYGEWSWLANLGGRIRLTEVDERTFVDDGDVFALATGAFDALPWLRAYGGLDAHLLVDQSILFRGGLTLGVELGTVVYASLAGRVSPWNDAGGHVNGQLGLGIRTF